MLLSVLNAALRLPTAFKRVRRIGTGTCWNRTMKSAQRCVVVLRALITNQLLSQPHSSNSCFFLRDPIAKQRRVYDMGYIRSLNEPNVELIADDAVVRAEGDKVYTRGGRELRADVVVLATGFKVRDCELLAPICILRLQLGFLRPV